MVPNLEASQIQTVLFWQTAKYSGLSESLD